MPNDTKQHTGPTEEIAFVANLSIEELRDLCRTGLERGELWRPDVIAVQDVFGNWYWHDRLDDMPINHCPFPNERAALLNAIEVNGLEYDPDDYN